MARPRNTVPDDLNPRARALKARRNVQEIDEMRFIREAVDEGAPQAVVAEALSISQATVSRVLARLAANPTLVQPSVAEVVDRAVIKDISRTEMIDQLLDLKVHYVHADRNPESNWGMLRRAVQDGLVTNQEASVVANDVAARLVSRVGHSMNLEGQQVNDERTQRLRTEAAQKLLAEL